MRLEAKKYSDDIQQAAGLVAQFTAGKDFADYQREAMLRLAAERAFGILGEAMSQLLRLDATLAARISGYHSIIAFRNILVHAYAEVDDRLVWDIVQTRVPTLIHDLGKLMEEAANDV